MSSRTAQAGFTLVELLVALAILGLSMAVMLKVISDNLDRSRRARDEAVAASLVQSLLARAEADAPRAGISSGTLGNGYSWRLEVAPYPGAATRHDWPVDAVTIAATVTWRGDAGVQSRSLTTMRVIPKASAP